MKITIHYPKQAIFRWSYRFLEVLKNGKREDFVKSDHVLEIEVNVGDEIQVKSGMIKSNIMISDYQTDLWIELSALAKYNRIVFLIFMLSTFTARYFVEWELKSIFTLVCVYTGLACLWAYIMIKGNHIMLKESKFKN